MNGDQKEGTHLSLVICTPSARVTMPHRFRQRNASSCQRHRDLDDAAVDFHRGKGP